MIITTSDGTRSAVRRFFQLWGALLIMIVPITALSAVTWYGTGSLLHIGMFIIVELTMFREHANKKVPGHPINSLAGTMVSFLVLIACVLVLYGNPLFGTDIEDTGQRMGVIAFLVTQALMSRQLNIVLDRKSLWGSATVTDAEAPAVMIEAASVAAIGVLLAFGVITMLPS